MATADVAGVATGAPSPLATVAVWGRAGEQPRCTA